MKLKFCLLVFVLFAFFGSSIQAQSPYKSFKIGVKKDTLNRLLLDGTKVGRWVIEQPELRGEPGYTEEGEFVKGYKHGPWRKYTAQGDLVCLENYFNGGKDGIQQYFTYLGDLVREESWRGYDPLHPYDTIAVYGTGNNEIVDYKIVKAEPYSVKDGEWNYYDPASGKLIKTEVWELNNIKLPGQEKKDVATDDKKKVEKTPQMLEWEKKNRGKKGAIRDGRTGY